MSYKIQNDNAWFLEVFEKDIAHLAPSTRKRHISNVSFFIDIYLWDENHMTPLQGIDKIDDFLGYFFIHQCMWSTPGAIGENATSIKKFYATLLKHKMIAQEQYDQVCSIIKRGLKDWKESCLDFNEYDF